MSGYGGGGYGGGYGMGGQRMNANVLGFNPYSQFGGFNQNLGMGPMQQQFNPWMWQAYGGAPSQSASPLTATDAAAPAAAAPVAAQDSGMIGIPGGYNDGRLVNPFNLNQYDSGV